MHDVYIMSEKYIDFQVKIKFYAKTSTKYIQYVRRCDLKRQNNDYIFDIHIKYAYVQQWKILSSFTSNM